MPAFHAQHVLRHDRKHAREGERPERGRAQKYADTDTADIRARKIEPLAVKNPSQHELRDNRRNDRERRSFVTLENAVEKMTDEQNERDKERRDVAIVEAKLAPDGNIESRWLYC